MDSLQINHGPNLTKPSPYRWIILILAVSSFLMGFLSRFAWPPLVPVVAPALNINMTEAGAYMAAYYIGYIITQIPAGLLGDKYGVRLILAIALITQAAATYYMGAIHGFRAGFVLRVISGLAGGCIYAVCFRLLALWFTPNQRGLGFGILMATPSMGLALTNGLVPMMEGLIGWRGVFRAIGLTSAAVGVASLALMRENPVGPAQENQAPARMTDSNPGYLEGLKYVLGDKNIMLLAVGGFTLIWAQIGFSGWVNTYLNQELNLSLRLSGNIMAGFGLIGIIAAPLCGYVAGRTGQARRMLIIGNVVAMAGIALFGQTTGPSALLAMALLAGLGIGCLNPVYGFAISSHADPALAATTGGVTCFIYQLAGVAVPLITGWVIDRGSFAAVWLMLAAGPLAALICVSLVSEPNQAKKTPSVTK
ncbi:MAG: MFS transporter [Deltaproteobacteria bacterium]|jgi:sugar phosphate permease|nr:MFS transporter [Deltaproteobacteria bacterium]